jgi:hypothetical protein
MNDVIPYEQQVGALTVHDVRGQVQLIQQILRDVMQEGVHYGKIPGTEKPSLFKAGAEKLNLTFRFDPQYETVEKQDGLHLTITSKCTLWHIPSGQRYGSGMGSCSTRESRYAYRQSSRKCPSCGKEAIIKGKEEFGGGWLCFKKKDGCGAKFDDKDEAITKQVSGRVPNEDIADQYNTVLKMANKRSLVAAILNTTAASDIFTQDMEDTVPAEVVVPAAVVTVKDLEAALKECGVDKAKLLAKAEVADIADIDASDRPGALKWIKANAKKAAA